MLRFVDLLLIENKVLNLGDWLNLSFLIRSFEALFFAWLNQVLKLFRLYPYLTIFRT